MQCIKKFTYAELTGSLLLYRAKSVLYFIIYFINMFFICAQAKLKTGSNISRFLCPYFIRQQ